MTTFPDLHIMANMLGITLTKHSGGLPGYYTHATRTISTRRASLGGTEPANAVFSNVDLTDANLIGLDFSMATMDEQTKSSANLQ